MQVQQKEEYFGATGAPQTDAEKDTLKLNLEKMKKKVVQFGKQHREFPSMQISFYTRAKAMEVCFGDIENEEENISASILKSLLKLNVHARIYVAQNIVLSGGSAMIPGFKVRVE